MPAMSDPTTSQTQAATPDQVRRSATLSTLGPHAPAVGERYRIESILAKGGMGEVYKAHDLALNRAVAIKVLLGEPANFELAARRFLHEASIGAQLQHPIIPPVYDIGQCADGRPFLAMKLVKGRTLNELLKDRADLAAERGLLVAIFESIAQAIGYAHSRGVIHRDLKPSNVMVGAFGEVQVMDWGLAKFQSDTTELTPQESVASTFHDPRAGDDSRTSAGSIIGTPAYMPPEQAIGAVDKVTERSDVFGLGALLCSILTGQPPYVASDPEATRQLAAQGKLADAFARLDASGAEPELVALAKRCLNPDAAERPANGSEVATAVARFRAEAEARARQAEVARNVSDARRRVLAWSAAAVIVVLAAGVAVSVWQADRAKLAESKANDEARDAREARDLEKKAKEQIRELERNAETNSRFYQDVIYQASPNKQVGKEPTPNLTVGEALKFAAENVGERFVGQPKAEAALRHAIGTTFFDMGQLSQGLIHLERAWRLRREHLGVDHELTLESLNNLGVLYKAAGRLDLAESTLRECLAFREKTLGADHVQTLNTVNGLATVLEDLGRFDESETYYRRAYEGLMKVAGEDDDDTLSVIGNLGYFHTNSRFNFDKAEDFLLRAYRGQKKKRGELHPKTIQHLHNLAWFYGNTGKAFEADQYYKELLDARERALGKLHPQTLISKVNAADFYMSVGKFVKAEAIAREAYEGYRKIMGDDDPDTLIARNRLALVFKDTGRFGEALKIFDAVLTARRKVLGDGHERTIESLNNLGTVLDNLERYEDAEPFLLEALRRRVERFGEDDRDALGYKNNLGYHYWAKGDTAKAEEYWRDALERRKRILGDDHVETLNSLNQIAALLQTSGRAREAEPMHREVLAARRKRLGASHPASLSSLNNLAALLLDDGRAAEAEVLCREHVALAEKTYGAKHAEVAGAKARLGQALLEQKKPAEAEPLLREALAIREAAMPNHWSTANTKARLGRALQMQAKPKDAEPLLADGYAGLLGNLATLPSDARRYVLQAGTWLAELYDATHRPEQATAVRKSLPREPAPPPRVR
jgi:hypothetical protein